MSLRAPLVYAIPQETARIAHAAFPNGNPYVRMRDTLGPIFTNPDFAALFPQRGQPAEAPARLALVTILQFAEDRSDRQAADAVRARLDWKYLRPLTWTTQVSMLQSSANFARGCLSTMLSNSFSIRSWQPVGSTTC